VLILVSKNKQKTKKTCPRLDCSASSERGVIF
jgi:hypothetical protein